MIDWINSNQLIYISIFVQKSMMGENRDVENQLKSFWEKEPVKDDGEAIFTLGKHFQYIWCIKKQFSVAWELTKILFIFFWH